MQLKLTIEPQQASSLHSSAVQALHEAALAPSLDVALDCLKAHFIDTRWVMGRGGHHVWLSRETQYEPIRIAMIEEVQS